MVRSKQALNRQKPERMPIGSPSARLNGANITLMRTSENPSPETEASKLELCSPQLEAETLKLEAEVLKLATELQQEKGASVSLNELYLEKERQVDRAIRDCAEWKMEAESWKKISNEMKVERAKIKDQRDELQEKERQRIRTIRDCGEWKEEAESWKKISNEMKVERAKFKDQRDQLQTQLAELQGQVHLRVREVLEKDAQLNKLGDIAQESVAQWYWEGSDDQVHAFAMEATPKLEQAFQNSGGRGTTKLQSGMHVYDVNFDTMTQTNVVSGKQRALRRRLFGAQDAEPVEVVKLALMARSQEVEMARVECARAQQETRQMQVAIGDMKAELLACSSSKQMAERELEELRRQLQQQVSIADSAQQEIEALKDKDDHSQKQIIELRHKLRRATQDAHHERCESERRERAIQQLNVQMLAQVEAQKDAMRERDAIADGKVRSIAEFWKGQVVHGLFERVEGSASQLENVTCLFKELAHKSSTFLGPHGPTPSRCTAFQQLTVHAVYSLHNPGLWQKYSRRKEELKCEHQRNAISPTPLVDPPVHGLKNLIENLKLDASLNEVLLGTGCSEDAANAIVKDGFDIRFAGTNGGSMYGEGIYFSNEMCKCNQYTDTNGQSGLRHVILARVTLGDPALLRDQYQGRLPPIRPGGPSRYDSNVVKPQLSQRGQAHWEYVIFDGAQAYPEMLVTYTTP